MGKNDSATAALRDEVRAVPCAKAIGRPGPGEWSNEAGARRATEVERRNDESGFREKSAFNSSGGRTRPWHQ